MLRPVALGKEAAGSAQSQGATSVGSLLRTTPQAKGRARGPCGACGGRGCPEETARAPLGSAAARRLWQAAGREGQPCHTQHLLCCEPPDTRLQVLGFQGAVVFGDETCGEHQGELCATARGCRCPPPVQPDTSPFSVMDRRHIRRRLSMGDTWVGVSSEPPAAPAAARGGRSSPFPRLGEVSPAGRCAPL